MNTLYLSHQSARLRFWIQIATPLLFLILAGCVNNPVVSEADRDKTGSFDGLWLIAAEGRAGVQFSGNETLRCSSLKWKSYLKIEDGKGSASLGYEIWKKSIYIDSDGKFSVSAKTSNSWSDNKTLVVNLYGKLEGTTGSGYYTIGRAPFYGSGCRYKVKFEFSRA